MHYYQMADNNMFSGLIMMVISLLFITLLVIIIFKISKDDPKIIENETKSIEIIKERYAKGEINQEEFNQLKKDLSE